jgi:hypothetical protein
MATLDAMNESRENILCKSCGLCCNGHLFAWVKLRPAELDPAETLGLNVFRSDPNERGFSQPCPLWRGECTIHASPHYPHACRSYNCKLLKEVMSEKTPLPHALTVVEKAKEMIHEVEALLPASPIVNFRERLVAYLESLNESNAQENIDANLRLKADELLKFYARVFGVKDLIDMNDEEP